MSYPGPLRPPPAFTPTDIDMFKSNIRSFAAIHKKSRFQPDKPSPFAEVFDKLDKFVTENCEQFSSRFTSCGLAIGGSDAGPIMAVFPARVAEFLDVGKRCILRHLELLGRNELPPPSSDMVRVLEPFGDVLSKCPTPMQ
jgi:hypothetical protein